MTLDFMHKNFSDYFTLLLRTMSERASIGAALGSSEAYLVLAVSRPPRLGAPRGPVRKGRSRPATGGTVPSRRPVAPSGTSGGRRRGRGAAASCGGKTPGVPSVPPRKVGGLSRRRSLRGWPSGREKGVVRWLLSSRWAGGRAVGSKASARRPKCGSSPSSGRVCLCWGTGPAWRMVGSPVRFRCQESGRLQRRQECSSRARCAARLRT